MIVPYNVTPLTSYGIGGLIHKSRSIAGTGRGGAAPRTLRKKKLNQVCAKNILIYGSKLCIDN